MKKFVLLGCVCGLTACGGGGGVTNSIDNDYSNSGKIATSVVKEYSNGDSVVIAKGDLEDGGPANAPARYYFVLSQNADSVVDTMNGVVAWDEVQTKYVNGMYYGVIRRGVNASGENVTADTDGLNLNLSGNEYVSLSVVSVGEDWGVLSSGTVVSQLPSGKFTYEGGAVIHLNGTIEGDDNLLLVADFDNAEVSFTASTDNLYTSATGIPINKGTGSFSGDGATIGERSTTFSIPASVIGAFAGSNAGGVHGVMYPTNDDQNNAYVTFLGNR